MRTNRRFAVVAALTAGVLALAGCGSDVPAAAPGNGAPSSVGTSTTSGGGGETGVTDPADADAGGTADPQTEVTVGPPEQPAAGTSGETTDTADGTDVDASTTGETAGSPTAESTSSSPKPTPKPKPAKVAVSPKFGTNEVNPAQPLTVTVTGGRIAELAVYAEDGSTIDGTYTRGHRVWTSTQDLRYGGSYHAVGTATGEKGSKPTKIDGTWTTFDAYTQETRISPYDGQEVGVAAPIIIDFNACVADHAEVEKHVTVTTEPKVELRGTWIVHDGDQCRSLDLRPKEFWPEGTTVHVEVDLLGVQISDGVWGGRYPVTSDFTIGRNQVTYADPESKMITVKQDGKVVAQYPTSMGRGDDVGDPNLVTRSGIHIVMDKQEDVTMSNPEYGYKDLPEKWAVRISNNGEFIHQNLATVDVQGVYNVSHGCLNLNAENAEAYFHSAMYGDPVVITGTSVQLSASDGDVYDWAIPWKEWKPLHR